MSTIGSLAFRAVQHLRRSSSIELFHEIADAPRLPAERARADQLQRLHALLAHAERNVPYYAEVFRSLGITSRDIRSLDDFARLPVLTKDIVRERHADLVRTDVPRETLLAHHSGGSTGVPLTFYRDRAYLDASMAGTYRNLAQAGWRPGDMVAFFWGWNETLDRMPRWQFELRQWLRRMYQFDPFRSGPADMDGWVRVWRRLGAKVVLGYASTIARFAEHVEQTGQRIAPVAGVFTTAEKLYPQQREVISRVFGCRVYDCYGSSEVQNIAVECGHGGMHVNADFVVLETDPSAAVGEATPLLATSLWNYAMPFIRYRNEDCGRLVDGGCACGGGFPLMELNVARVSDNFVLPGGRVVHGEYFTHLMYGSEGVATFQFHQTALDRIVLRVVPVAASADAYRPAVARATAEIEALAAGAITVDVEVVDTIPLSSAGKHRFTRSDVAAAQPTAVAAPVSTVEG
jgi:phenylacetate-CoA ligase